MIVPELGQNAGHKMPSQSKDQTHAENVTNHPTWEVLGIIIGFVSSANNVPQLANTILNKYSDPNTLPHLFILLSIFAYFVLLVLIGSTVYLLRTRPKKKVLSRNEQAVKELRRAALKNFIKQFPVSLMADLIYRAYGVWCYNYFDRRGSEWPERPDFFNTVARFSGHKVTLEYQFARNFKVIEVRKTSPDSSSFGSPITSNFFRLEKKWLLLTSWFGIYWWTRHLLSFF